MASKQGVKTYTVYVGGKARFSSDSWGECKDAYDKMQNESKDVWLAKTGSFVSV